MPSYIDVTQFSPQIAWHSARDIDTSFSFNFNTKPMFHHRPDAERHAPSHSFQLKSWLRLFGGDLITMALMGALALGIYEAPPAPSRSFPVYFQDGKVVYPQFAYPRRKDVWPIYAATLVTFFVPFLFFALFQIRRRSLYDLLTTTLGLLRSLITSAVFQVWIKWLIGGLRPHFLTVCQPNIQPGQAPSGTGFANLMYDRSVCTGDTKVINDSLQSFPSGHATAGFAGLIFLSLYFNAQLKVMSAHKPGYWTMILFFVPILGATLIAGARITDGFHNWYDVVAGGFIGTCFAVVAFRQTFAAVFDFRFNHLLLPRTTSIFHRKPWLDGPHRSAFFTYQPSNDLSPTSLPVTREGGWGWGQEAHVGAPFDASAFAGSGVFPGAVSGTADASRNGNTVDDHESQNTAV